MTCSVDTHEMIIPLTVDNPGLTDPATWNPSMGDVPLSPSLKEVWTSNMLVRKTCNPYQLAAASSDSARASC